MVLHKRCVRILGTEDQSALRLAVRIEQRNRVVHHNNSILQRHEAIHQPDAVRTLRIKEHMHGFLDAGRRRRAKAEPVLGHRLVHLLPVPALGNLCGLSLCGHADGKCGSGQAESGAAGYFGHGILSLKLNRIGCSRLTAKTCSDYGAGKPSQGLRNIRLLPDSVPSKPNFAASGLDGPSGKPRFPPK